MDGPAPHSNLRLLEPSDEERERPPMWRYWRALAPKDTVGMFLGAWHTQSIVARVQGTIGAGEFARRIDDILRSEKMLCDEGIVLLKYGFHLSEVQ